MSAPENSAQKTREKSQIRRKYYFQPIFLETFFPEIVSVTNKVGLPGEKDKMLSNFLPRKEGMLLLPCLLYAIHLASYSDGCGGLTWPFFRPGQESLTEIGLFPLAGRERWKRNRHQYSRGRKK